MTFEQALAAEMRAANVTQDELARELGVAQGTISAWVNGSMPRLPQLRKLIHRFPELASFVIGADTPNAVEARRG